MTKDKLEEKHNCDILICYHNNTKGLCCLYNPDNCKYRQLQKENTELKADNSEWEKTSDKWKSVYELTNNQLTNAKEIIKGLLSFVDSLGNYSGGIFAKAEQFLSEVEK